MIRVSVEPLQFTVGQDARMRIRFANEGTGTCTNVVFRLALPAELLLVRGQDRVEIEAIRAGQVRSHDVVVHPRAPGDCAIGSPNFSYRNEVGQPVRNPDYRVRLLVRPAGPASAGPALSVGYAGGRLVPSEWNLLRLVVRNDGTAPLRRVMLTVEGGFLVDPPHVIEIPVLACGAQSPLAFWVRPKSTGSLPVMVRASYLDDLGSTHSPEMEIAVAVGGQGEHTARADVPRQARILFLASNPTDLIQLQSDKEMGQVESELRLGEERDSYDLKYCPATKVEDINRALIRYTPKIVHFSGHGGRGGYLYVEDESRYSAPVRAEGIAEIFANHKEVIHCVILNACYSLQSAEAIARHIRYVVAMRSTIGDEAAIAFSVGFYQAIAGGLPVLDAFKQGRALVMAKVLGTPEHDSPVLYQEGARYL
jgi:hypothetical protein